ncbi:asparagine synthase (glutamine-hydrolyzing) [Chloroflexota bacterium]
MCGIAGIANRDTIKPVERRSLKLMTDIINHRGPDDEGYYIDGNIGLGHKRLSIIDLKTGHQPMSNEDGTVWIVLNGEIYNYLELRQELLIKGHDFKTNSDTEVVIHLYEEYGTRCIDRLNGMFAFSIWDKNNKKLFAARDRLGIKPFYYNFDSQSFVFSSEIKAILKYPNIPRSVNYEGIADYFTLQMCLGDKTMFQGIKKLLPGHYMILDVPSFTLKISQYWEIDYSINDEHTEDYFSDSLLALIEDAVKIQLRSDVAVGTHLSGGLDTSIITCLASKLYGSRIKTFTGGFKEGKEFDETDYAKIVARFANTEYSEVFCTASDFAETLPSLIYFLDEPVAGPGVFPQYCVSKLASKNVKAVLGGQGGDEVFGGYTRYFIAYLEQCLKGAIFQTQEGGKYVATLDALIPNLPTLQNYVPMLQYFWEDGLFESMDKRYFRLIDRSNGENGLLSKDFRDEINSRYSTFDIFQQDFNMPGPTSYINKMARFDIKNQLPALLQVEDRTSMAVSLESRVPLLDHRIAELAASMPPSIKFLGGDNKHILRKAVSNIIPNEILQRKDKMGFPVPLNGWLENELKDFVQSILLSDKAKSRKMYNREEVEKAVGRKSKFSRQIWGLLCLELWFREFIDDEHQRFGR